MGAAMIYRGGGLLATAVLMLAMAVGSGSASAADFHDFGFESVSAEESTSVAGVHPDVTVAFTLKNSETEPSSGIAVSAGRLEDLSTSLPPGLVANPNNVAACSTGQFVTEFGNCPADSQVGLIKIQVTGNPTVYFEPLYNLEPPNGSAVARLGFWSFVFPTFIDVKVRTASDYGITATLHNAPSQQALVKSTAVLWGNPADPIHDEQRLTPFEAIFCQTACSAPEGKRPSGLSPLPFMTNPTACEEQAVGFAATTYQLPGQVFEASAPLPPITGCENVEFGPELKVEPASHTAGEPTGLSTVLRIPQTNAPNVPANSAVRAAKITLPEGMTINAAAADGLEGCSPQQVALGKEIEASCPRLSKLGTATFVSPALPEPINGSIYQRAPEPGHLFRIWLVADEFGMHLKLPGEITANKESGRLTATFNDLPQLPVEEIALDFKDGARAPLKNPDVCGSYVTEFELTSWSRTPPVGGGTQMKIDQGCNGGGFNPDLEAGVTGPVAGAYSPLVVNLTRPDGDQNVSSFEVELPPGLLAKLKGVQVCPDDVAATGACPGGAQIGHVNIASGAGPEPLWVPQPGKAPAPVYLAGAYKGAPYSVVTKVPAQAGPFDLGTVAVRAALNVDPDTARATVETDPLPQILEGVPVLYRIVHAEVDRDEFTIAPTNCRAMKVDSTVTSVSGAVSHPTDRFQIGECAALRFGPKLRLRLIGGTDRGAYPALTATLKTGRNEANLRKISVALPHSEYLAQEHIKTICTRVQFEANVCPKGSIYGYAKAVTPLLAKPLKGPVYLRSSKHKLPDLVVALDGQFDINLVGHIDSVNESIRTTFTSVPDAPVTKFVLRMAGGAKSLLVNSTDICARSHRATVRMDGQNGKLHGIRPSLQPRCGGR